MYYPEIEPKKGVALILVLGILAIMLIMAVAFSTVMRTERVASGNYTDSVRARHLVHVALARALEQIQTNMGTNLFNASTNTTVLIYPYWSVTNSFDANTLYTNKVDFLSGSASNYVPGALWQDAADANNSSNYWLTITNTITNIFGTNTNAITHICGRVAYMIINCSGLLDANYVGSDSVSRGIGTNVNEIAITNLYEVDDQFFTDRDADVRYETLYELSELALPVPASNLFVYSYFPYGIWTNATSGCGGICSNPIPIIGLSESDLSSKKTDITNAFYNLGFTNAEQCDILYTNLINYVDDDSYPGAIDKPYVEHIPMINEIVVSNTINIITNPDGTFNYFITNYPTVEIWNPCVTKITRAFSCDYRIDYTPLAGTPANFVPGPSPSTNADFFCGPTDPVPPSAFKIRPLNTTKAEPGPVSNKLSSISFKLSIDLSIVRRPATAPPMTVDGFISNAILTVTQSGETNSMFTIGTECLDPRYNWNPQDTEQWKPTALPSLYAINNCTADYWATNLNCDSDSAMYVADETIKSIGELGYLVYSPDEPWHTVKLYGTNAPRLLDKFAVRTNRSYYGLVNPNSEVVTDALAAVFFDMPVDEYPNDPDGAANRLSNADARSIAGKIYNSAPYTNLSDVYQSLTNEDFSGFTSVTLDTELKKESFIRNTAGLFSVRQNLFTILIEANPASGNIIPTHPAKQRAVALVWRDPFTGEFFVRYIKWLED